MRDLVYFVAVSLDGRIASPTDTFDAFSSSGDHLDWIAREYPDTLPGFALDALGRTADNARFDTVVMGWRTYAVGFPFGVCDPYPHLRSYVVTHDPEREIPGDPGDVTVTAEDPVALVRRLKDDDGADIWLCGGGQLAATLVEEIDRLVLKVNPVVLGNGIPLFADVPYAARAFTLERSTPYASGVVVNEYTRAR